jgi:hypothetical protein
MRGSYIASYTQPTDTATRMPTTGVKFLQPNGNGVGGSEDNNNTEDQKKPEGERNGRLLIFLFNIQI